MGAVREKGVLSWLGGGFVLLTWKAVLSVLGGVGGLDRMTSTSGPRIGLWKRIPGMVKMVMLVEGFAILFLSSWLYEEYVSNPYMQAYLSDFLRSDVGATAILGAVVTVIAFTITGMLYRTRSAGRLEGVSTRVKLPFPAPTMTPKLRKGMGPEPTGPFHPVVAALKAEISGIPTEVGSVSGLANQPPGAQAGVSEDTGSSSTIVSGLDIAGTRPLLKKVESESQAGEKTSA